MSAPELWTDQYIVHSYHSDRFGKLRINVIANFLQESAWLHSNACGIGYKDLLEIGKMWILSGLKIKVSEYPSWGDVLTMNTWGNDYEDPFAYRDFELLDASGKQVVSGSTSWLLINVSNHRPNRILPEYQKIPPRGISSGSGKAERIPAINEKGIEKTRIVNSSDIDIYQHVNNAKYVEYCTDLLPVEIWGSSEIEEITVNYISECLLENELRFSLVQKTEMEFMVTCRNETLSREVFRAHFLFRKKMTH
jgi:medium-chain acyl-[acyl-carrier-protein] hydrolase